MIKNIEDLIVWQKARLLNNMVYSLTKSFPSSERNNLIDQLRRAVASICANIVEGFGRYHLQESIHFYRTARGSLLEVKSHLYIAVDQAYISQEDLLKAFALIDEIGKMLNGLINSTRNYRQNAKS